MKTPTSLAGLLASTLYAGLIIVPSALGRRDIVSGPRFRNGAMELDSLHSPRNLMGLYYDIEREGVTPRMDLVWHKLAKRYDQQMSNSGTPDDSCPNR
jgi:hypothetical protein